MILDFIYIPVIILIGLGFINLFDLDIKDKKILRWLLFFHLMFGTYYCFFIIGDAIGYWEIPKSYSLETFKDGFFNGDGTYFVYSLNYIFSNLMEMSYLSNTLLYSLFGFMGITFFYIVALKTIPYNKVLFGYVVFPLLLFMPNLHFWSSAVGKDTLLFLCIGMMAYALLLPVKRIPLIIFSLVLSMAIRPHITLFMLTAFGTAYVFGGKVSVTNKFIFSILFLGLSVAILPKVMTFIKLDSTSMEAISARGAKQADNLAKGANTGVDISSYPFPLQVLTFLYRPFFFDVRSIVGLVASFENLLLVILTFKAFRHKPAETFKKAPFVLKGLLIFLVIGTLAFAPSLGNIGVMIRMRNMLLPGMLLYFMWCYSYEVKNKFKATADLE